MILQLKSLRDITGIPANEAMMLKARLYDAKGLWNESTRLYEDLLLKEGPAATDRRQYSGLVEVGGFDKFVGHRRHAVLGGADHLDQFVAGDRVAGFTSKDGIET